MPSVQVGVGVLPLSLGDLGVPRLLVELAVSLTSETLMTSPEAAQRSRGPLSGTTSGGTEVMPRYTGIQHGLYNIGKLEIKTG